jgi:hypothetical protein
MERSSKLRRKGAPWLPAIMSTTLSRSLSELFRKSRTLGLGSRIGDISSITSRMAKVRSFEASLPRASIPPRLMSWPKAAVTPFGPWLMKAS